jgi:hypothetical protein
MERRYKFLEISFRIALVLLLTIIAITLIYNAVSPEQVKNANYFKYKQRSYNVYSLEKYKCKSDDGSNAYFYIKSTDTYYFLFNIRYKTVAIESIDYFGEKDSIKLFNQYIGNKNCEFIDLKDVTQFSSVPAPEPIK